MDPALSGKVYIYTSGIGSTYDSAPTVLRAELLGGWAGWRVGGRAGATQWVPACAAS